MPGQPDSPTQFSDMGSVRDRPTGKSHQRSPYRVQRMVGAHDEHLIRASTDWAAAFRARKVELGLPDDEIDRRAGLPTGYCNKILNAKKKPGAEKIDQLRRALKLEVVLRPAANSDEIKNGALEYLDSIAKVVQSFRP